MTTDGSGQWTIRCAVGDDIAAVLSLWSFAAENGDRPVDTEQAVRQLLDRDAASLLVAESPAGEVAGTLIAGWDGWRAHLYRLCVHPRWRSRGVAAALVAAAGERLQTLGATRLDAMVLEGNEQGRHFWASAGFRRQETWRRWIRPAL